jgi:hypothetical protein
MAATVSLGWRWTMYSPCPWIWSNSASLSFEIDTRVTSVFRGSAAVEAVLTTEAASNANTNHVYFLTILNYPVQEFKKRKIYLARFKISKNYAKKILLDFTHKFIFCPNIS